MKLIKRYSQLMVIASVAVLTIAGCQPSRTTRMTTDDFNVISAEMAASLAKSIAMSPRTADSPTAYVTINKVTNLTSDVMTESEQWYLVVTLRDSLDLSSLRREKNIRFVIPAERLQTLEDHYEEMLEDPDLVRTLGSERKPTHEMSGEFQSVTRVAPNGKDRTDLYYFEATITDLATGERIWTDKFEYKRAATGHIWD